jgi:1-acyl-sn-glycerol-3-phosphate acyltransferase
VCVICYAQQGKAVAFTAVNLVGHLGEQYGMDLQRVWEARNWIPFGFRTAGYAVVSLTTGPFTQGRGSLWAMRNWCQSSSKALGINVIPSGLENIPEPPFVYCSNHQSVIDILCLGSVLPHDYKWAAKRSVMSLPFLGWHLKLAGHIPVDRKAGPEAAAKVIERFCDTLRNGKPVLIFPEGTRSETGAVKYFKKGAFIAATEVNVPVVPVSLEGTHTLMQKGSPAMREDVIRDVHIRVGKPIYPNVSLPKEERIDELRDRCRAAMVKNHLDIGGKPFDETNATQSQNSL